MPKLFGDSWEDFKRRIDRRPWIGLIIIALVLLGTGVTYQFILAQIYMRNVEASYNRAFQEMVDNVRDLNVSLTKGMFCNSPRQLSVLANEIYTQAASAKANLGMLPLSDTQVDNTSRFLGQVGDYTYSLSKKTLTDQTITEADFEQMKSLQKYAQTLNDDLSATLNDVYAGKFTIGRLTNIASQKIDKESFVGNFTNIEKEFSSYPSLIYDGPFSSHLQKMEATYLKGKPEISMEAAREKAKAFIGDSAKLVEYSGEANGTIASYGFMVYPDPSKKERYIRIDISKLGGLCVYFLDNRQVQNGGLSVDDCKKRAVDFLGSRGYINMKDSYFETENNIATINYAYTQSGCIMYTDLIKIKVAMDSGEILGFEAQGYIMSHKEKRNIPSPNLTMEQAKERVNKRLAIKSAQLALIPTDGMGEVYCYEFKGTYENKNVIVYINIQTGFEEEILLLIESPEGILSM